VSKAKLVAPIWQIVVAQACLLCCTNLALTTPPHRVAPICGQAVVTIILENAADLSMRGRLTKRIAGINASCALALWHEFR